MSTAWIKMIRLCPGLSYIPGFFGHFESLAFFSKMAGQTLHQSSQT